MPKHLLPVVALMATVSVLTSAVRDNVGVGLGTSIFEGHDGLLSQICAATTNGISTNQLCAITSGTSGARPYSGLVSNERVQSFVHDNLDQFAREAAAGKGESIETLAEILSISKADQKAFAQNLQRHFGQIFTSPLVTNFEVVTNLAKLLEKA